MGKTTGNRIEQFFRAGLAAQRAVTDILTEHKAKGEAPDPEARPGNAERPSQRRLEELAFRIRGEPKNLATTMDAKGERKIAWAVVGAQIEKETDFIAAALLFMLAAGWRDDQCDERDLRAAARIAALWWHGQTEGDVED